MIRDLREAIETLSSFLARGPLTQAVADLERNLEGLEATAVLAVTEKAGVNVSLLDAAMMVRGELGRINDLIHASAISLVLPRILERGERVTNRPSLAAGNDPTRPFDVETDRRVAEFKLAQWKGADAMRKRQTFKDLVHLAAEDSGRIPELYVVGDVPARFLRTSRSTAAWALDRSPSTRELFLARFGSLEMTIGDFTAGPGHRVRLANLAPLLEDLGVPPGV